MTSRELTPKEIVKELDKYIVAQTEAKKAVAVALRNRWRRMQLDDELKEEITPKNILIIDQLHNEIPLNNLKNTSNKNKQHTNKK